MAVGPDRRGVALRTRLSTQAGHYDLIGFDLPLYLANYANPILWHPRTDPDQTTIWLPDFASRTFKQKSKGRRPTTAWLKPHRGMQTDLNVRLGPGASPPSRRAGGRSEMKVVPYTKLENIGRSFPLFAVIDW